MTGAISDPGRPHRAGPPQSCQRTLPPVGGFTDKAGREAYLGGYHAALAFIVARSGKRPKTHRGTRSAFSLLARGEARIGREQIAFLGWTYELKAAADYGSDEPVSAAEAHRAIAEATAFVERVAQVLTG